MPSLSETADLSSAAAEDGLRCACAFCSGAATAGEGDGGGPQAVLFERGPGVATPNGKPSFSSEQAAAQLTRTGLEWAEGEGGITYVSYAYRASTPTRMPSDIAGFSRFSATQIESAELALKGWSDVANIVFVRTQGSGLGGAAYSDSATILFGNYASGSDGAAAFAYFPGSSAISANAGDIWVRASGSNVNPALWEYGFQVLTHEIGHAIGLSHPSAYNADGETEFTYAVDASYYQDARQYTSMSYFASSNTGATLPGFAAAPQLDDIAAAQRLYGANMSTRAGDTVYGFNSTADRPWFSATDGGPVPVIAVWDGGGTDTFDWSGYSDSQAIDLRQGAFSNIGGFVHNVAVAVGAILENAVGGSGSDTLNGNDVRNILTAGLGDDFAAAWAGADEVKGGDGNDALFGNGGDDLLLGDDGADYLDGQEDNDFILGGGGADRLLGSSGADLLGGEDGEDFLTGGEDGDNLYGGAGADVVFGEAGSDFVSGQEGDDVLGGGGGSDRLNGGAGSDRFIVFEGDSLGGSADVIEDFFSGGDILDLRFIDADRSLAGDQAFVFVGQTDTPGGAGTLRLGTSAGGAPTLYGYTDVDGVADLVIQLSSYAITAADIWL